MYEEGEYSSSSTALVAEADCYSTLETISRKKGNNKRRFSDDQIKSLETMFDSDTKLEPRKKLQVAKELGLQPRQVAIWFQNKRARWKSKQLEKDYSILQAKYDNLTSQFDILQKEKQSLATQLQKLYDRMERSDEENQDKFRTISGNNNNKSEYEMKPDALSLSGSEYGLGVLSDDDSITKAEYFKLEEPDLFNIVEVDPVDGSLTSSEYWEKLESSVILDQSGSDCQWWDFWS